MNLSAPHRTGTEPRLMPLMPWTRKTPERVIAKPQYGQSVVIGGRRWTWLGETEGWVRNVKRAAARAGRERRPRIRNTVNRILFRAALGYAAWRFLYGIVKEAQRPVMTTAGSEGPTGTRLEAVSHWAAVARRGIVGT
jgi:hypothetical protein